MIDTRHLVDREILPMLDMPDVVLTPETLAEVRANPLFTGDDLPPAPFPITEARAPVEGGPDARLVVIDPPSDKRGRGAILHIHGGGMVVGTADNAGKTKWDLAEDHDCVIVSVDYRLCPENPFPAPQEDCYAGLVWLAEHADELNVDPDRIVCMGESAGGCLAASLAQMTRDRGGPRLAGQVLIYHAWEPYQYRNWQPYDAAIPGMIKWLHLAGGYGHLNFWRNNWQPQQADRAIAVEVEKAAAEEVA